MVINCLVARMMLGEKEPIVIVLFAPFALLNVGAANKGDHPGPGVNRGPAWVRDKEGFFLSFC